MNTGEYNNRKAMIREIHVVHNTHWDREFRASFQRTRRWLVDMMDRVIETLEANRAYKTYMLDSQTIPLLDYLDVRPEMEPRLRKLIKARRLLVGPWFTLPDSFNVGGESLVRNLLWGRRVASRFGAEPMRVGYTPFNWGQPSQLPQIYSGFGIDSAFFYRGISPHEADSEFLWRGADGSELIGHRFSVFARYNWYYLVFRRAAYGQEPYERAVRWDQFDEVPFAVCDVPRDQNVGVRLIAPSPRLRPGEAARGLRDMLEVEAGSYTTPVFLALHGHDFSVPHPIDLEIFEDAKTGLRDGETLLFSNLEDALDSIRRALDRSKLKVLEGERRGNLKTGQWTYLLPDTISARTYLKVQNFAAETDLTLLCEPLLALAAAFDMPYPRAFVDRAWRYLLSNHTHDAVAGCAPDHVCLDMEYRLRQAREIAAVLTEDAMQFIARNLEPDDDGLDVIHLVVFNSLPYRRRAIQEVAISVPRELGAQSLEITDAAGNTFEYQELKISNESVFVDSPLNVPNFWDNRTFRVIVDFGELPPLGYKVFTVRPRPVPDRKTGSMIADKSRRALNNGVMTMSIRPDGSFDLVCGENNDPQGWGEINGLNVLEDRGECGNAWRSARPRLDRVVLGASRDGAIWIEEEGPLRATVGCSTYISVSDSSNAEKRSDDTVALPVVFYFTLKKSDPRVYVKAVVDNRARDHRLRVRFPAPFQNAEVSHAETHFDVVRRPIHPPDTHDWREPAPLTHPMRSAVCVEGHSISSGRKAGLAVFTRGLHEYEVDNHEIALTLLRAFRIVLEVSEDKKQELPDQGSQCLGRQTFEYALMPYIGSWREAGVLRAAQDFNTPVRVVQCGRGKGRLPREVSLLELGGAGEAVFTALKQCEDGDGFALRFFNPAPDCIEVSVKSGHLSKAARLRLDETPLKQLRKSPEGVMLTTPPGKIETLKLVFSTSRRKSKKQSNTSDGGQPRDPDF
ncbi:MAG: glycoside hydrolase family 38 C-terminal domain-containing protein [Candidatus Sumerlaeia bacterium]